MTMVGHIGDDYKEYHVYMQFDNYTRLNESS